MSEHRTLAEQFGSGLTGAALEQLAVNTIRTLAMDAVEKANSGHPGLPMGCADFAHVLWTRHLKFDAKDPQWPDRDRFILSAGHGCMLQYALLHLAGYDVSLEDLKNFRQFESKTPGHPELHHTPGIETTTGPLGQGFGNGVGAAIAEAMLAARFNRDGRKIIDHYTYAVVSDGDLMEGVASEAASLAGHLKLGKLVYFYDDNHITIDGRTELAYTEDAGKRFEAYGWHVQRIDGHDRSSIDVAIGRAREDTRRPSLIIGRTHIAWGAPHKQDSEEAHGAPLGEDEIRATKKVYGWPEDEHFLVPESVREFWRGVTAKGTSAHEEWLKRFGDFRRNDPEGAALWDRYHSEPPADWRKELPVFPADLKGMATRASSGKVLQKLATIFPNLVGGSADLAPSNKTMLEKEGVVGPDNFGGRNFHFGVREHGMGSVLNGMAQHGGLRVYGGTFLVFSDYMRPAVRLASIMQTPVTYVWTHDSIFLGEDGPTHQPIEHLPALRAIPGFTLIRPCDANETTEAWAVALERKAPVGLALTRQNVPTLDRTRYGPGAGLRRGGYVLACELRADQLELILIASGSEVSLAIGAHEALEKEGRSVRVVSLPSWEIFAAEPADYRESVLPARVTRRLAIEAASPFGWERWVGNGGRVIGMTRFGASAPDKVLGERFGFTVENVLKVAREMLAT
jgi:transketolase